MRHRSSDLPLTQERRRPPQLAVAIVSRGARQKRKRVRPPGSAADTSVAERGALRYTFHGGGPCDGALNGAAMPEPLASGSAGQPWSAHAVAMRATAPDSVTRTASPSITTSASRIDTATEHRGSRARLRALRVPTPVWNQNVPSTHRAPTAVTCGLPSSLTVDSHVEREFAPSGRGVDPASSFSTMAAQSTGGSPSALPRLTISIFRTYLPVLAWHAQSATRLGDLRRRRSTNRRRVDGSALRGLTQTTKNTRRENNSATPEVDLGLEGSQ